MIQGKIIKQIGEIQKKEVNYRELKGLNCSMIKLFDNDPVKFFEQFKLGKKKKDEKNTSLLIGDLVDFYLLDCNANEEEFNQRFDEKFALFEETKGSGQVFYLADKLFSITMENTDDEGVVQKSFESLFSEAFRKCQQDGKYKGGTEEKGLNDFNNNGKNYYDYLISNIGKSVVDISLVEKSKKVAELIKSDPFTSYLFDTNDHIENLPKFTIEWIYHTKEGKQIECKSELDLIRIDHSKKIIYPKDLKTNFDNENFEYSYLKYRYDLQAAFYFMAVKYWAQDEYMKDYSVIPMDFIVGDTSSNNRRPLIYRLDIDDTYKGLYGYSLNGKKYKGVNQLIEEISWAEDTGNWNISKDAFDNKGIMKLNFNYDKS